MHLIQRFIGLIDIFSEENSCVCMLKLPDGTRSYYIYQNFMHYAECIMHSWLFGALYK